MCILSNFMRNVAHESRSLMPMCIVGHVRHRTAKTVHAEPKSYAVVHSPRRVLSGIRETTYLKGVFKRLVFDPQNSRKIQV